MKNSIYTIPCIASVLVMATMIGGCTVETSQAEEKVKPNGSELQQLLSEVKKTSAQYTSNCGNEASRKKAGWLNEEACLQDGRVHLVYKHTQKGVPFPDFKSGQAFKALVKAVAEGASISIREELNDLHGHNENQNFYHCTAVGLVNLEDKQVVNCSSNTHRRTDQPFSSKSWDIFRTTISTNGDWVFTGVNNFATNLESKVTYKYSKGIYTETFRSVSWFVRY